MRSSFFAALLLALAAASTGCVLEVESEGEALGFDAFDGEQQPAAARDTVPLGVQRGLAEAYLANSSEADLATCGAFDGNGEAKDDTGGEPDPTPWRKDEDDDPPPYPGRLDNECAMTADAEPDPTPWKKPP